MKEIIRNINPDTREDAGSKQPALELLKKLGYKYFCPKEALKFRSSNYQVLFRDTLRHWLDENNRYEYKGNLYPFSAKNIEQAIADIDLPLSDGLVRTNEKILELLLYGKSYEEITVDGNKRSFDIKFINWNSEEFNKNLFYVTDEYKVERIDGMGHYTPDIVLFVNGIPLGVIENKRSSQSIEQGITQHLRNQDIGGITQLYKYSQILVASSSIEAKYATTETPKKFWSIWKEPKDDKWQAAYLNKTVAGRNITEQDKLLVSLFEPARFLEILRSFIVFDYNTKIIARHQQFFAIKEIVAKISTYNPETKNRQGGVIWHTQGSGKSLTMVMLTKYVINNLTAHHPKIVVVTDRIELDKQICKTYVNSRLKTNRATSGRHLIDLLAKSDADIITSLVHKFDLVANEVKPNSSKDIFVIVDECHRTQSGEMHVQMRNVFPNACYLGFTGTPLLNKDKRNTEIRFGPFIHKYTISDAVEDKTIVPLLYEGRVVEQSINDKEVDKQLDIITRNLNDKQKKEVKDKWARFERIASSEKRIKLIAYDIHKHFLDTYKSKSADGKPLKAMLATNRKSEAIKYLRAFEEYNKDNNIALNVAVIISPPDTREGEDDGSANDESVNNFWSKMLQRYGSAENYEDSIKTEFIKGDEIDLLIVVDKLLTGFDAPCATVLYLDKTLKEHSLLQAIARVNRLYDGKDFGYIIDYRGLLTKLDDALQMYSGAGLENYDPKDLQGAIFDVLSILPQLRQHHSDVAAIFKSIANRKDEDQFIKVLFDEKVRQQFYSSLSLFGRFLGIALESQIIYNAIEKPELNKFKDDLRFWQDLRIIAKKVYSDGIDNKEYEKKMQNLMDNYVSAIDVYRIMEPVDILDEKLIKEEIEKLASDRAKADLIRTRMTKHTTEKMEENPVYYMAFSKRIQKILEEYMMNRMSEIEYYKSMKQLWEELMSKKDTREYPINIKNNKHAQVFFANIEAILTEFNHSAFKAEVIADISAKIDSIIKENCKRDWKDNRSIHDKIRNSIDDVFYEYSNFCSIERNTKYFDMVDKIADNIIKIAINRYVM